MKYSGSIVINKPRETVTALFINPEYIQEYQDGFIRKNLQKGEMGQAGAVSEMLYSHDNKEMILIETIVSNDLPQSFEAHYHHKHMDNIMKCEFLELDANRTEYKFTYQYTRMSLFPKIMSYLIPKLFSKPAEKWMNQFKAFVENH
ncbi:MAG: SRPBCC family protein [Bacteroidota bacterium]